MIRWHQLSSMLSAFFVVRQRKPENFSEQCEDLKQITFFDD